MRIHGRYGLIYLSVRYGDPAAPAAYLTSWTIAVTHDVIDETAFGDTQKRYTAGLVDIAGSFTGLMDDATSQAYIAATDGLPRNMYLYPSSQNMAQFFSGQVLPDFAAAAGVTAAVTVAGNWAAVVPVTRTTSFGTYTSTYTSAYT